MSDLNLVATDLYKEGEKGIYSRMTKYIRKRLQNKVENIAKSKGVDEPQAINTLAKKLGIEVDVLTRIFNGTSNGEVNYRLFDYLEFPLELSIQDVLERAEGLDDPETEKKWLRERKEHPICGIAALAGDHIPQEHGNLNVVTRNELEFYVSLRAIKELE